MRACSVHRVLLACLAGLGCSSGNFTSVVEDAAGDTTADDTYVDTNLDVGPCNPGEVPSDKDGVFVSPSGDDFKDGSAGAPARTVTAGLALARNKKKSIVYLDVGTYEESVAFGDTNPGVFVEGGWRRGADGWRRNCPAGKPVAEETVIKSSDAVAVRASNDSHLAGLRQLTVATRDSGAAGLHDKPGQSIFAVFVTGTNTQFALDRVIVLAGSGGKAGDSGSPPTDLPGPTSCKGSGDCGEGADGTPGSPPPPTAAPGVFGSDGFTGAVGAAGTPGTPGKNGKAGSGESKSCATACPSTCVSSGACTTVTSETKSSAGACGCGGGGGFGGLPGHSGGASVAVMVFGGKLTLDRSVLRAGKGGDGSTGSKGGLGGPGSAGGAGVSVYCSTGCSQYTGTCGTSFACYLGSYVTLSAGTPGGAGGTGGAGSEGGGGPGGPSYALVLAGGGVANGVGTSLLSPAKGGAGASGAASGASAEKYEQP